MRDETWRAMEDLVSEGKVRNIGVCNYSRRHLEHLLAHCRIKPLVLQVELHPLNAQADLVQFCRGAGVRVQAYASLGGGDNGGPLLTHPVVTSLAQAISKAPAQILLKWAVVKGFLVIPKTRSTERMKENMALDFVLTESQVLRLDTLDRSWRRTWKNVDPDGRGKHRYLHRG